MPTRGDLIIADSNNLWSKLALGVAYSQLFVNSAGTGAEWSDRCRNSMARAYLNADQTSFPDAAWTKINLDTEAFDIGGNYDISNKRYVAPVTGYYIVGFNAGISNTNTVMTVGTVGIYVNGVLAAMGSAVYNATAHMNYIRGAGSSLVYVVAGQYIELYAYADSSDSSLSTVKLSASGTFMSIILVSL